MFNKYLQVKSKLVLLYLRGLRGFFEKDQQWQYGRNSRIVISLLGGLYLTQWFRHNFIKHEFDIREQPNFLIPKFIYDARREHSIYWEQSRLARGKSTTYSYYDWDPKSQMIFYCDRKGVQQFEKNIFNRERLDIQENPLFEDIIRNQDTMSEETTKRANLLIAYQKNINNRYDLDNHLHHKSITVGDFVRAVYYNIYVQLNLTNKYRYDQFVSKSDEQYEFEKLKVALNVQNRSQDLKPQWLSLYKYYVLEYQKD